MSIVRTRTALSPTAGVTDDIEAEDDARGPEPEEHHGVAADLMLRMSRQTDSRIPLERRARRTLGQMMPGSAMLALLSFATRSTTPDMANTSVRPTGTDAQRRCTVCRGKCGRMADTSSGGVTRQTWHQCSSCRGSGVAR
ncbi:hypothetical protein J7E88_33070 [Streptomyces sp. ISL-10]|uniref:hypothetical protein n=1 Tax=Streptomyces sp. ISL-10 TaxID=2819172 RepID=UPI001BE5FD75|nr:hypothetical protein [Streptomyces sp. ISL-10]MBT2369971.1 hypothetical protein [Streptomyces sp. ISL-10]